MVVILTSIVLMVVGIPGYSILCINVPRMTLQPFFTSRATNLTHAVAARRPALLRDPPCEAMRAAEEITTRSSTMLVHWMMEN